MAPTDVVKKYIAPVVLSYLEVVPESVFDGIHKLHILDIELKANRFKHMLFEQLAILPQPEYSVVGIGILVSNLLQPPVLDIIQRLQPISFVLELCKSASMMTTSYSIFNIECLPSSAVHQLRIDAVALIDDLSLLGLQNFDSIFGCAVFFLHRKLQLQNFSA
jgi:hypothetical protein